MPVSLEGLTTHSGFAEVATVIAGRARGSDSHRLSAYVQRSRVCGRVFAVLLLIPAAPIIGLLALLIRLTSPGPAIFRQSRVGLHGNLFYMVKLRTMRSDAEAMSGPAWAAQHDPRVTRLGRLLRKLHLDELPQLWNVAKGEMAFIGPRPERPEFVRRLAMSFPNYMDRLAVTPGITGLAQIRLPPDSDLESVRLKLRQDFEYLESANLALDLRILSCTALRISGIPGDWASRLVGLYSSSALRTSAPRSETYTPLSALNGSGTKSAKAKRNDGKRRKPR